MQSQEKKRWSAAMTAGFFLVISASFMTWGTIRTHYTWQFMANLEHPGLCNRILTLEDHSDLKIGAKINLTGSVWNSGFDLMGFFYPHWLLMVAAVFIFALFIIDHFNISPLNPTIPQILSFYGVIHVMASALGFFSQGAMGSGLILTGIGYLAFLVISLRRY